MDSVMFYVKATSPPTTHKSGGDRWALLYFIRRRRAILKVASQAHHPPRRKALHLTTERLCTHQPSVTTFRFILCSFGPVDFAVSEGGGYLSQLCSFLFYSPNFLFEVAASLNPPPSIHPRFQSQGEFCLRALIKQGF